MSGASAPEAGHPNHDPMLHELKALFNTYQVDGVVTFEYDTQVYYGQIAS